MNKCKNCNKKILAIDNGYCNLICMYKYIEKLEKEILTIKGLNND